MMKLRAPKGEGALTLDEIDGHTAGLIALGGRAMLSGARFGVGGLVDRLVGVFGRANTYLELQRHLLRDEEADNHALRDLAGAFHVPIVATNGVRFAEPADRPLYDVLTCIRHKTHAGRGGTAPELQRRALPQDAGADGEAVRRHPRGARRGGGARRSAVVHDGGSRLPLSGVPGAARGSRWRRSCARSRRRARASATGRSSRATRGSSSASWI